MITGTVIPSYQLAINEKATTPKLNLMAAPTVSFSGTLGTSEMQDDSVSAAKLKQDAFAYAAGVFAAGVYAVNLTPDMAVGYTAGAIVRFQADTANTGAVDINVDARGAKDLVKLVHNNGAQAWAELDPGDIRKDAIVECIYNGVRFQVIGLIGNRPTEYATATGTDTYAISCVPPYATLAALQGKFLRVRFTNANTVAATLAVDGLAATAIRRNKDQPLVAGDIKAGQEVDLCYDGTFFTYASQLGSPSFEYASADSGAAGPSATTVIVLPTSTYTAYAQLLGRLLWVKAGNSNIGPVTIQVAGIATPPAAQLAGRALMSGDLKTGQNYQFLYDGTAFQLSTTPAAAIARAWVNFNGIQTTKVVTLVLPGSNQLTVAGHGITAPTSIDNVQMVSFRTSTTLHGGLAANLGYFVRVVDANTITLHTTRPNALTNTSPVVLTSNGAGTVNMDIITIRSKYGVTGIIQLDTGNTVRAGIYRIFWENQFLAADYCIFGTAKSDTDGRNGVLGLDNNGGVSTLLVGSVDVQTMEQSAGGNQTLNPLEATLAAFGFA